MREWRLQQAKAENPPEEWADELAISPLLLNIIWNRGYDSKEKISQYLNSPLRSLPAPDKLPQISKAANLLATELLAGKKLTVWGDYDVDGITSTALVLDMLEFHGFSASHYLPNRINEGYGLNIPNIEKLAESGCQLLLSVDCGISDVAEVTRAVELGMTVIISDHHLPPVILPPAHAIVNPHMENEGIWPFSDFAGVGVAFYLMARLNQILASKTGRKYRMDEALDLVGLGTLADIMPLAGENRVLARGGLAALEKPARPGFGALKIISGLELNGPINSWQAVFRLAPRINAAGRMGNPEAALELLRTDNYGQAEKLASLLDKHNSERKSEENRVFKEAAQQARDMLAAGSHAGLVLYGPDWHPGIIGIVASRIVEEFGKPAIVLCSDAEFLKGSGRSVEDFDLYAGLKECAPYLEGFGGHKLAAGVRLHEKNLDNFRCAFSMSVEKAVGLAPRPMIMILERELSFSEVLSPGFVRELELLQPFGPANPEPVFLSKPLILKKRTILGSSGEHLSIEFEEKDSGRRMTAKAWRMASSLPSSMIDQTLRIAFTPKIDTWNGFPSIDLGIKDWKRA